MTKFNRAEAIEWLATKASHGYDYTIADGRIKDNEKATQREYWNYHDMYSKLSTPKLKKRVAQRVINSAF